MSERVTNAMIERLCIDRGYNFQPWESRPWEVDNGPSPWPAGSAGADGEMLPKGVTVKKFVRYTVGCGS
jgi:hypothetical protein